MSSEGGVDDSGGWQFLEVKRSGSRATDAADSSAAWLNGKGSNALVDVRPSAGVKFCGTPSSGLIDNVNAGVAVIISVALLGVALHQVVC